MGVCKKNIDAKHGNAQISWWSAGYRGSPKIFWFTEKILRVGSLIRSAFSVSVFGQHLL